MLNLDATKLVRAYRAGADVDGPLSDAIEESGYPLLAEHVRTNKNHAIGLEMEPQLFCPYLGLTEEGSLMGTPEEIEAKLRKDKLEHRFCIFNRAVELHADFDGIADADDDPPARYREMAETLLEKMGYKAFARLLRIPRAREAFLDLTHLQKSLPNQTSEEALDKMEEQAKGILKRLDEIDALNRAANPERVL